eukprot:SAG11_NODE_9298_length_924_cov_3.258182_1_plen_248_part_01
MDIENEILKREIDTYHRMGWQTIADLYGVRNGDPHGCCLPRTYALVKLKAILAAKPGKHAVNVLKGRPIAPHTKHPNKHVYNRNATGHHLLLTHIRTSQRVTRLWKTSDYPLRTALEKADLQRRHTARWVGRLKFVVAYGDLDGMYTNISHARMDEALENNIKRLRDSSMPGRRFPMRNLDRVSVAKRKTKQKFNTLGPTYNKHEQVEVTFEQMKAICKHSNDSSYMRVGREIRHYHMGTPMGEQGSC